MYFQYSDMNIPYN
jgi:hypothetical protein